MHVFGKWADRVDTPEGREEFKRRFKMDVFEYMIDYEATHITRLSPKKVAHIAILEYDRTINQFFTLEDQEHVMIYSSGCMEDKVFNTDGMAFMRFVRESKTQEMYCLENSPWDADEDDWYEDEYEQHASKEDVLNKIREKLLANNIHTPVTLDNVLFVRQL